MPTEISSVGSVKAAASSSSVQADASDRKIDNGSKWLAPKSPDFTRFSDLNEDVKQYIGSVLSRDIQGVKGLRSLMNVSREHYKNFSPLAAAGTARQLEAFPGHVRPARFDQLLDFFLQCTPQYTGPRTILISLPEASRADGLAGLARQLPHLQSRTDMTGRFDRVFDACHGLPQHLRPAVIVGLAGGVGAVAPPDRVEKFEVMRALVHELPDPLRADGLAALARQLGAIGHIEGRTGRFDSILDACKDLPDTLKSRVHVALAASVGAVAANVRAGRFQTMLDLVGQMPDAQRAEGLAGLAGQLCELDTMPDPTARFDNVLGACRQLPAEHQPAVLIALAGSVRTMAVDAQVHGFDTMFELVNGLADAHRAEGLAALGEQIENLWQLGDEQERFDRILNACETFAPQHKGVALAGLAAGISRLDLTQATAAFKTILEEVNKVPEPAVRAKGLAALARQIRLGSDLLGYKGHIVFFLDLVKASASLTGEHRVPVLEALAGMLVTLSDYDQVDGARTAAFDAVLEAAKAVPANCRTAALLALTSKLGLLQSCEQQMGRFKEILSALDGIGDLETSLMLAALANASGNLLPSDSGTAIDCVLEAVQGVAVSQRGPVLAALARQNHLSTTQYLAVLEGSRDLPARRERDQVLVELAASLGTAAPSFVESVEQVEEAVRRLIEQARQSNDPPVQQRALEAMARGLTWVTHSDTAFSDVLRASKDILPAELQPAIVAALAPRAPYLGDAVYASLLQSIDGLDDEGKGIVLPKLADAIPHCRDQAAALAIFDAVMDRSTHLPRPLPKPVIRSLARALCHLPQENMQERFRTIVEGNRKQVLEDATLRADLRWASEHMEAPMRAEAQSMLELAQEP